MIIVIITFIATSINRQKKKDATETTCRVYRNPISSSFLLSSDIKTTAATTIAQANSLLSRFDDVTVRAIRVIIIIVIIISSVI